MKRYKISIIAIYIISMLVISSIQVVPRSGVNDNSDQKENQIEKQKENNLKVSHGPNYVTIAENEDLTNTSINAVYKHSYIADWVDNTNVSEYMVNFGDDEANSLLQFGWSDENGTHTGLPAGVAVFNMGFRTDEGLVEIFFEHEGGVINVFNDSDNTVPYDGAFTMNTTGMPGESEYFDDIVFNFTLEGDLDYIRAFHPEINGGITNLKVYEYSETIEKQTSTIHFGIGFTSVNWDAGDPDNGRYINATADYEEMFHFYAVDGVAELKWDFILENISIHPSFIGIYDPADLSVANVYEAHMWTFPEYYIENLIGWVGPEPFVAIDDLKFNGIRSDTTDTYFVNLSNVSMGDVNLGAIDMGGEYFWNDTSYEDIVTTIAYTNQTQATLLANDNSTYAYFTQTYNKFNNESIVVDPEITVNFRDMSREEEEDDVVIGLPTPDDDDDDDDDDAIIPFGNTYLLFLVIGIVGIVLYKKRKLLIKK